MLNIVAAEIEKFNVLLQINNSNKGSITIDWSKYDYNSKIFKVYRSKDNNNYETISIDYTQVKRIDCLQVYPKETLSNQLEEWMKEYGKGIINVSSISIETFNSEPEKYLKQYDVVFFGTDDFNGYKDINESAVQPLKEYIQSGKGVIFGHDTFWIYTYEPKKITHFNFNQFADDVGIKVYHYDQSEKSTKVTIAKTGLITTYPNYLETGKTFEVPATHISNQEVIDTSNINFYLHTSDLQTRPNRSFYVTTKNNVAFIQTGHSGGQATNDEKMIIANLIFYCYQLVSSGTMTDNGAIDETSPTKPVIVGKYGEFGIFSEDEGTQYYYKVESYSKDDTSSGSYIAISNTVNDTVITGISKYCYTIDHDKNTEITLNNIDDTRCVKDKFIYSSNKNGYLHVCSVDEAGNISPTSTIKIRYPNNTCENKKSNFHSIIQSLSLNIFISIFN